ncbi:CCA-adding tRNA nucleotidyltransferase [Reticulomyxa filosa]|uniref:CCA-adding tRNA nucleotidyltransferase n=1 Tax=Reticulomyxa filosa TaxID=46433 RepID=X6N1G8_RETFI|nr:CCA-adding tRNA nucleotidyltransferase [Reticulomyxa filosa]|eukprot:ETO20125.1 CCA-adding tRNA nucleotidyltransferase [Reticulomyxa filosa]
MFELNTNETCLFVALSINHKAVVYTNQRMLKWEDSSYVSVKHSLQSLQILTDTTITLLIESETSGFENEILVLKSDTLLVSSLCFQSINVIKTENHSYKIVRFSEYVRYVSQYPMLYSIFHGAMSAPLPSNKESEQCLYWQRYAQVWSQYLRLVGARKTVDKIKMELNGNEKTKMYTACRDINVFNADFIAYIIVTMVTNENEKNYEIGVFRDNYDAVRMKLLKDLYINGKKIKLNGLKIDIVDTSIHKMSPLNQNYKQNSSWTYIEDPLRCNIKPQPMQFLMKCHEVTLQQDILHRDFTINTLLMRLADIENSVQWNTKHIIDLTTYGIRDCCKDQLIQVNPQCDMDVLIKASPIRILRAIKYSVQLNFKISDTLSEYIRNHCHRLLLNVDKDYSQPIQCLQQYFISEFVDSVMIQSNENVFRLLEDLNVASLLKNVIRNNYEFGLHFVHSVDGKWPSKLVEMFKKYKYPCLMSEIASKKK